MYPIVKSHISKNIFNPLKIKAFVPNPSTIIRIFVLFAWPVVAGCATQSEPSERLVQYAPAAEIETLTPLQLLDHLVMSAHVSAESKPVVLKRRRNYVKFEEIPHLIERLDSKRPCLAVATSSVRTVNSLSTEDREAAYLVLGFRCLNYPPTISSNHFEFDVEDVRAWWEIMKRKNVKPLDSPVSRPITLPEAEKEAASVDILEKLFRFLFDFQPSYQRQNAPAYFLAVDEWQQDPNPSLLTRFSSHKPDVLPVSVMDQIDNKNAERPDGVSIPGVLFYARKIGFVTNDFVKVTADYYEGPLSGFRATFSLQREGNVWVVTEMSDAMIS